MQVVYSAGPRHQPGGSGTVATQRCPDQHRVGPVAESKIFGLASGKPSFIRPAGPTPSKEQRIRLTIVTEK